MSKCKNVLVNINKYDKELILKCEKLIKKYYIKDKHAVITGILDSDNKMFFGLSQGSPSGVSICGEPCALSQATLKSKTGKFKTIVSLRGKLEPPLVIPPCGICRELLRYHYPNINVIILDESSEKHQLKKIKSKYLLPYPYYKTRKQERNAYVKDTWCARGHYDDNFNPDK